MTSETNGFDAIGLRPELAQTLTERGYVAPTPIQAALIPAMLAGQDVIGQSQTGSGKTAAFALPILQALQPPESQKVLPGNPNQLILWDL